WFDILDSAYGTTNKSQITHMKPEIRKSKSPRPALDAGYWMLDTGYLILDTGYWILDTLYWMLDAGYWMNPQFAT
ncbi:MAG: hypothetical protein KJ573_02110, partial [Proteobacteria bacterium]|nr:hypothetical protein [Pseudomonadota bacterium]